MHLHRPKNRHTSGHIDRIIKEHIILVKICLYKIKHKKLMEDYYFFSIFLANNKLVTAVLCFGSHICNQAARIRVNKNFRLGAYLGTYPNPCH